ncbi:MAG: hypothetical protein ABIG39_06300 [Candidatus Micrarchaeota archaeon]
MCRRLATTPLFFILLLSVLGGADDVDTVVRFEVISPEVVLTGFNITPDSLIQGQTADFSLTMQNLGLSGTTVNGTVYIYNSLGNLVDSFTYDPVSISTGSIVIVVKTWDSDSLPAGMYMAYANATYDVNRTNTLNVSFTITSIPPAPSGSVPSGGAGGTKPKPTTVPVSITPVGDKLRFAELPVVKELLVGEGDIESFTLVNRGDDNITVRLTVDGVGDWVTLQQNKSVVFSNSTSVVNFFIEVPEDVLSGNYLMKLEAIGTNYYARDYMLLRVKNYPEWHQDPIYLKTIRTDILEGTTDVLIRVKNPSENSIKKITLKETIPRPLRGGQMELVFKNKRGEISNIRGFDVISWKFTDIEPLEEVVVRYTINDVLIDYHVYGTWHLRQMDIGAGYEKASLIRIIDLSSETISPGGSGDVTATILYAGEEPMEVTAMLELPSGFYSDPGYTSILLIPRGLTNVNFHITAPRDVSETHLIRAVVMGDDFNVFSSAPVVVKKGSSGFPGITGITGIGAPAVASVTIPGLDLLIVGIAGVFALALLVFALSIVWVAVGGAGWAVGSGLGKPIYDFERVKMMGQIRDVMGRSIRGLADK